MKLSSLQLQRHRRVYFSQLGEDGLLEYVLSKLPARNKWCVEFGAWDGQHLSNCYHLIRSHGYKSVLIELDSERSASLQRNMQPYGAICLNRKVGYHGNEKLDLILSETPIPSDFDVLSIDIDSDDLRVWEAAVLYRPKVVIIEINIRDLPGVERVNVPGSPNVWGVSGNSISSMSALAKTKGYSLLAMVGCNAVYVRIDLLSLFHAGEPSVADVFTYEGHSFRELSLRQRLRKAMVIGLQSRPVRSRRISAAMAERNTRSGN
jgi:hypothetical protein